jgi:hypothetical protein
MRPKVRARGGVIGRLGSASQAREFYGIRERQKRINILAAVVGFGNLPATSLEVFAIPADGCLDREYRTAGRSLGKHRDQEKEESPSPISGQAFRVPRPPNPQ